MLKTKDAPLMLEWMHDDFVVHDLKTDFAKKDLNDCLLFIANSLTDKDNINLAIVDDNDEYMGTVSLKHISIDSAEFAITVRSCAMGKGYSKFGMNEIINRGFMELKLNLIYWCVSPQNKRAVRFYEKNGFKRVSPLAIPIRGNYTKSQINEYYWFAISSKA